MIVQKNTSIQRTKDAGAEWYRLLALLFTRELGMVSATGNKLLLYWEHKGHRAFLALATDDIILAVTDKSLYYTLLAKFNNYFAYTTT